MYKLPFEVPEISYEEALGIVRGALRFGIEPLLETVEDMLAELGDPDLAFECVQVAGTNGKTSTTLMLEAMLAAAGLRTAAVGNIGRPIMEIVLDPELAEIRRIPPERLRPWPSGTGPAVRDWLLRQGYPVPE